MSETILIPLISVGISAIVALITTILAQRLIKKQSLEQNYDDKLEELQNLYIEVKIHIEAEIRDWWISMEHGNGELTMSNYIYPIDKIIMLTQRFEPSLSEDIEQVLKTIQILKGNNDPEDWMPFEEYYYQYIKNIDFYKINGSLAVKFKKINQKYYQKRSSKSLLPSKKPTAHSNKLNQNQLPHTLGTAAHKTITNDEW